MLATCKPLILPGFSRSFNDTRTRKKPETAMVSGFSACVFIMVSLSFSLFGIGGRLFAGHLLNHAFHTIGDFSLHLVSYMAICVQRERCREMSKFVCKHKTRGFPSFTGVEVCGCLRCPVFFPGHGSFQEYDFFRT